MGIKLSDFAINGIDVSAFNGTIDWDAVVSKKPTFVAIRGGYGNMTDAQFKINWQGAKGKVNRIIYWYEDYYSNWYNKASSAYGLSDAQWGKKQADNCWNLIKNDPEGIVFLDIENGGSSYSKPLTSDGESKTHAEQIARAFLERIDELNGKTNGIYCSVGLLTWFWTWFKNRPLWVAWYNKNKTSAQVIKTVSNYGWTGKCLIWQYASDGDINGDGVADGISFGMDYNFLDLNGWTASEEDYKNFIGDNSVSTTVNTTTTTEDDTSLNYIVTAVLGLWIRKEPNTKSSKLGSLKYKETVKISNISSGWGKLYDRDGYVSMSYIKKV